MSAHDGFTLMDTVSYAEKHNEANGEDNRDGHSDNHSDNMGAEGPTDDPGIDEARRRRRFAMLATLMVSQGVPMVLGGDEFGNSQSGNNNAYCQDNEMGWIDWSKPDDAFLAFCRKMIAFRREHPVLRQENFLEGATDEHGRIEVAWYKPDGSRMDEDAWGDGELRVLGVYLCHLAPAEAPAGEIFLVFNAGGDCEVALPPVHGSETWQWALNTAEDDAFVARGAKDREMIPQQSVAVFVPHEAGG
ncbi:glycogen debranching enzyme GlgX [Sinorhizobium fredii]